MQTLPPDLIQVTIVGTFTDTPIAPTVTETPTVQVTESPTATVVETTAVPPTAAPSATGEVLLPTLTNTPEPTLADTETASPTPTVTLRPDKTVRLLVGRESMPLLKSFSFNLPWERSCKLATELAKIGVVVADIPAGELDTTLDALENDPNVEYVEQLGEVEAMELIPDDPGYIYQTDMSQIRAPQGWELSTGSNDVTIAIIDSGVDATHPDFRGKIQGGCDFINQDNDASDDNGHGTHVAGIAAAIGDDGIGIAGVAWGAEVLPVKVLDRNGDGDYASVAAGIIWAADHGAQIINLSLGGQSGNRTLKAAIDYAVNKGVLVVAAAGNDGYSNIRFPAGYESVIAVGSITSNNERSVFSDYGSMLDVVAPGENVYSTVPGGYERKSGTSMSAPYVSGLAAVLWSIPGNNNARLVESEIEQSARDLGKLGWDPQFGFGLIRMDYALASLLAPKTTSTATTGPTKTQSGNVNIVMTATPEPTQLQPTDVTLLPTIEVKEETPVVESKLQNSVAVQYNLIQSTPTTETPQSNPFPAGLWIGGLVGLVAVGAFLFWRLIGRRLD